MEGTDANDPVAYLLNNEEYHEWRIVINDSSGAEAEVFNVQASHLSAHSLVFRTMLTDPKWIKSKTIEIPNITPRVFNMILRFVNGAGLPEMSREEAVDLALVADMYLMPRLKRKACKRLVPRNAEEVFLALRVVAFISAPDLELQAVKMIQEETEMVFDSKTFLTLDKRQLEFILKQDKMSVTEVEVWKSLVKWGQHRVAAEGNQQTVLRSVIEDLLKFVRLQTLTQDEIIMEVEPTKVLTDLELSTLLCCVTRKQAWNRTGFCDIKPARQLTRRQPVPVNASPFRISTQRQPVPGNARPFRILTQRQPVPANAKVFRILYSKLDKDTTVEKTLNLYRWNHS